MYWWCRGGGRKPPKYYPGYLGTGNIFLSKDEDITTRYDSFLSDNKLVSLLGIKINKNLDILFKNPILNDEYKSLMKNEYEFYLPQMSPWFLLNKDV